MIPDAVLLMAYGAPASLDEVEAYYTDIRRGRPPSPEQVEELKERYRRIGGRSPLLDITRAQATGLEKRLWEDHLPARVFVGMRHSRPTIREASQEILREGARRLVALVAAPHYSGMSVGAYQRAVVEAFSGWEGAPEILPVESYHDHPLLVRAIAERVVAALREFGADRLSVKTIFTAHSLPQRILAEGDPYRDELLETSRLVAEAAGGLEWTLAFQSASKTGEPWLGPDLGEALRDLARAGARSVLVAPIDFVSDHLEILHDLDHEARALAGSLGLRFGRTESLNASPAFVEALAAVVRERLHPPGR